MSDAHSHGSPHGHGHSTGGNDMNLGKIVVIGLGSLAIFAGGIIWSYRIMVGREQELHAQGVAGIPSEIGKPEIGIVDQVPFSIDRRLDLWKEANAKLLSSYGWVDRAQGIARIPIERAMEQVVAAPPDIPEEGVPPRARMPLAVPPVEPTGGAKPGGSP